jgi:hypothetical protein
MCNLINIILLMDESNNSIVKLTIDHFIPWLDKKFNEKYESSLESLKERFVSIFTIIKLILENVIYIHDVLEADTVEPALFNTYKPLLDNMIRLLDMMLREFPECIDLEFVEYFFISVQERIGIFLAHFHQIFHIQHSDQQVITKLSKNLT